MKRAHLLFLLPIVAVACSRPAPEPGASENGHNGTAAEDAAPTVETLMIESESVGPLRLGMSRTEVESVETMTFMPTEVVLEGQKTPALRAMRNGKPVGTVELDDGKASRIRIDSPEAKTAKGAHVGMTAKELQAVHGTGKVVTGEGNVCALFDDAPGLSFCFRDAKPDTKELSELVESEATVGEILVVGKAD